MNEDDKQMFDYVEFVATKFANTQSPWRYKDNADGLKHIRYERDYTGYDHWKKRLKRFFQHITKVHWNSNPKSFENMLREDKEKTFWGKLTKWPLMIRVYWNVYIKLDDNLPDGQVNGNITHWSEDGQYIAMMCPYVGQKVLEFIKEDPDNPHAQAILERMRETWQAQDWTKDEEEDD